MDSFNSSWQEFPFYVRFGAICVFRYKLHEYIGIFLQLLWKVQLLSLTLLISLKLFVDSNSEIAPFFDSLAKLFVIGELLDFENESAATAFLFVLF